MIVLPFIMKLIPPKVPCRCGPKLQKVRELGPAAELNGLPFMDQQGRWAINNMDFKEGTGDICRGLIERLTSRFDMDDKVIAATSIVNNKNTWPDNYDDAKGMCNW